MLLTVRDAAKLLTTPEQQIYRWVDDGRFAAYKVVDPSFHNWTGLAMALRDQQISDFPLCNKSFNLSYCGHDL
jgi:Ni,Fe-hydrogenase III large subunit